MMITSGAHIYGSTPVHAVLQKEQETERHYIVLNIGNAGQMALFVNSRAKALELARALEQAAQAWVEVDHEHGQGQAES